MSFVLSNYLNSGFDYVIFSRVVVMTEDIRKPIHNDITAKEYDVIGFTLTCSEETLIRRHKTRGDENEALFYWLHLSPYPSDYVIKTDGKTIPEIVKEIRGLIEQGNTKCNAQ